MATDRWQQFGIDYPEIFAYLLGQVSSKFVADHRLMDLITLVNTIEPDAITATESENASGVYSKHGTMLVCDAISALAHRINPEPSPKDFAEARTEIERYTANHEFAFEPDHCTDCNRLSGDYTTDDGIFCGDCYDKRYGAQTSATKPFDSGELESDVVSKGAGLYLPCTFCNTHTVSRETLTCTQCDAHYGDEDNTIIVLNPTEETLLRVIARKPRDNRHGEAPEHAVKGLVEYGFIYEAHHDGHLYILKAGEQWLAEHPVGWGEAPESEPTESHIDYLSQSILKNGVILTDPNNPYYLVQEKLDSHTVIGYRVFRDKTCIGGFGMNETAAKIAVNLLNEETHQLRERIAELEDVIREAYRVATDTGYETPALCLSYVIAELKDSIRQQ